MLNKLNEVREGLGQRFKEWKEEREAKRAQKRIQEYGFDRTPRRIRFAVFLATWAVVGFLILWVTQMTGVLQFDLAIDWALNRPFAIDWDLKLDLNVLPLIVLGIVSFAIVFWSKAWVSLFASTPWREWFSKWGALVLGIGGSVAIIMGGFEVNQNTREEDFRGALVEEQSAAQGRAAIQAQIESIDSRLASMRDQSRVGVYAAIAASVGAQAYDSDYLSDEAMARTAPDRRDIVRRARGAAVAADSLERDRLRLVGELSAATPAAATAASVQMEDPVSQFIGGIGAWRIVILVLVGDLILLLGNYFADKAEERSRYASSAQASGWADEAHRIEDKREEEAIVPQPMKPAREVVTDAETGEELVKVKPREYWRKRKGKVQKLDIQPEIPPDETGVDYDGGSRTAVTIGGLMDVPSADADAPLERLPATAAAGPNHEDIPQPVEQELRANDGGDHGERDADVQQEANEAQPEPSEELEELTFQDDSTEDLAIEPTQEPLVASEEEAPEIDQPEDHDEPREPETDPAKLIAAE